SIAMRIVEPISAEVVLRDFAAIKQALMNPHLSRTFDKRSYEAGNVREGVVSIMHGRAHRDRRRLENMQFRPDILKLYERDLFPPIADAMVGEAAATGEADLFSLGEQLSIVLAAKRAGFDLDIDDRQSHHDMVAFVDEFSQASAIVDAKDPDAIRAAVKEAHVGFHEQFGVPSITRRLNMLEALERNEITEDDLPHDILTSLLRHRDDPALNLTDDGVIVREAGTYLQGGTHTSSQTLINALDLMFDSRADHPDFWERTKTDLGFAQRVMHETLRLRPTTPQAKRRAEEATSVGDTDIPQGALVILDLHTANRDPELFGEDAAEFNPDRNMTSRNPQWGLSFGAGPHICPGRKVAGGLQQAAPGDELPDGHLFGLVAQMIQSVVQHDPARHPTKPQAKDDRTERFTRWREYWIAFTN
ncbi:MAG: cytochrome P450, partial [Acidimicrobiia bacterium]|nr:cytochrome P450 [Acidimicrobiia bacterium]